MMPEAMKTLLRDSLPGPAWERSLSEEGGKRYLERRGDLPRRRRRYPPTHDARRRRDVRGQAGGPQRGACVARGRSLIRVDLFVGRAALADDHAGDGADDVAFTHVHDLDALRGAPVAADAVGAHADDHAVTALQHDLVVLAHDLHAHQIALAVGEGDRAHADAAAPGDAVLADGCALAEAVLGDHEEVAVVAGDVHADDLVALAQLHTAHTGGVAACRPHVGLVEADGLAQAADHHDVVVARADVDGDDAVALTRRVVAAEQGLLHDPVRGAEDQELALAGIEVARVDDGADLLVLAQRQQVHDVLALGVAPGQRQLVDLEPVHLADAREEEQEVVRAGDEEMLDLVLFLEIHTS